jgi:hypothetical protein
MARKILGVRSISGEVFFGNVSDKGIISKNVNIIKKEDFENCMVDFIYHNKDFYNKHSFLVNLNNKKYRLKIKLEEVRDDND